MSPMDSQVIPISFAIHEGVLNDDISVTIPQHSYAYVILSDTIHPFVNEPSIDYTWHQTCDVKEVMGVEACLHPMGVILVL